MLVPLIPQRFHPADDNSQTQVSPNCPWPTLAKTRAPPSRRARIVVAVPHVAKRLHHGRRRIAGHRPDGRCQHQVRKATLTVLLDERGAVRTKQVVEGDPARPLAVPLVRASRVKVGLGGSGESTNWPEERPAGAGAGTAAEVERPAHHPRPGQYLVQRQPHARRGRHPPDFGPRADLTA